MDRPRTFLQGTLRQCSPFWPHSRELDFETIGKLLRVDRPSAGCRLTQWGGEQCTVIYLLSSAGGSPLHPGRYFNFSGPSSSPRLPGAAIVHFFGTDRLYQGIYPRAAQTVVEGLA